jgi:transposase InsO family protein
MTSLQGDINIERLCSRAGVSRSGYYRFLQEKEPDIQEMEMRDRIQRLFLAHKRRYGYRRIAAQLRIDGMPVNHKRVARLMREDNLLAVQPKIFMKTTDSSHEFEVALNLAGRMTLTGVNQLWVADITYIRLAHEFVFLAVVLDAFSRKVVGWSLGRSLKASLAIDAVKQAIAERKPPSGLVHHSDRGVQYACGDYVQVLRENGITPSMSRPGNPYDNAGCESFMRTLKREEIHANCYRDIEHLREKVLEFIEEYYNKCRLHSALKYSSPEAFERAANTPTQDAATMRYFTPRKNADSQANEEAA